MEQNKTLLIILSVALFLAAVLSLGLWFFHPQDADGSGAVVAKSGKANTFDPIEWVRTKEDFPALTEPEELAQEDVIIVYGEDPSASVPIRERDPAVSLSPPPPPAPPPPAATRVPERAPRAPAPPPAKPVARSQPTTPTTKVAPKTARIREYSIQVGSFSSRDRAEQASEVLREKGLAGQILSREVNGAQFYRLRIGPYTNKDEAEKFLGWVRGIQGFEDSLIFEAWASRPVVN